MRTPTKLYDIDKFTLKFNFQYYYLYFDGFCIGHIQKNEFFFSSSIKSDTRKNLTPLLLKYFDQCEQTSKEAKEREIKRIDDLNDKINESIHK